MRHRRSGVKLNRTTSHRQAMFRNMVTSLLKYDRIKTTDAKAKELRRWADHIVTLAKRGDLHARRAALSIVREKDVVHKLFEEASQRFGSIHGGYTRIVKIGRRAGDAAAMTLVELVRSDDAKPATIQKTRPAIEEKPVEADSQATKAEDGQLADADEPTQPDAPETAASASEVEASDKDAPPAKDTTTDADPDETGK